MKEKLDTGEIYSFLGSPAKNQHFGEDCEGPYIGNIENVCKKYFD